MNRKVFLQLDEHRSLNFKNDVVYKCPICHKGELYWNVVKHLGGCWGCPHKPGYNLKTIKRIAKLNYMSFNSVAAKTPAPPVDLKEYTPDLPVEAQAFLCGDKSIPPQYLDLFEWNEENRQIAVQLFNCNSYEDDGTRISRSIDYKGWYIDAAAEKQDYIFIPEPELRGPALFLVEGVFDAVSIAPYSFSIALLGTAIYDHPGEYIAKLCKDHGLTPVIWMDEDKAGTKGMLLLKQRLRFGYGLHYEQVVFQEPNDIRPSQIRDIVGDMDTKIIQRLSQ